MIPNRSKRMTIAQLKERMDSRFRATDARSDARFDAVDARFDAVDARFETVNARFDSLDAQFRRLFRSVESLAQRVGANTHGLAEGLEHVDRALCEHDQRIRDLEPPPI
jgi:chromosome segregation ATPase